MENDNTETTVKEETTTEVTEEVVDVEALREALKKANSEAASYRHKAKGLEEELNTTREKAGTYKKSYLTTKAANVLSENGATNPRIAKMLDFDKIDIDDDGNLVGVEEQLEALREDFPELFDVKRRAGRADAADKTAATKPKSSAEKLIARVR